MNKQYMDGKTNSYSEISEQSSLHKKWLIPIPSLYNIPKRPKAFIEAMEGKVLDLQNNEQSIHVAIKLNKMWNKNYSVDSRRKQIWYIICSEEGNYFILVPFSCWRKCCSSLSILQVLGCTCTCKWIIKKHTHRILATSGLLFDSTSF